MKEEITRNGVTIFVGNLPFRNRPCIGVNVNGKIVKVGGFDCDELAEYFVEKLKDFAKGDE